MVMLASLIMMMECFFPPKNSPLALLQLALFQSVDYHKVTCT